jgi:hypothetical protein
MLSGTKKKSNYLLCLSEIKMCKWNIIDSIAANDTN